MQVKPMSSRRSIFAQALASRAVRHHRCWRGSVMCEVFTRLGFWRPPCVSRFGVAEEFRVLEGGRSPLLERSRCPREAERPRGGASCACGGMTTGSPGGGADWGQKRAGFIESNARLVSAIFPVEIPSVELRLQAEGPPPRPRPRRWRRRR